MHQNGARCRTNRLGLIADARSTRLPRCWHRHRGTIDRRTRAKGSDFDRGGSIANSAGWLPRAALPAAWRGSRRPTPLRDDTSSMSEGIDALALARDRRLAQRMCDGDARAVRSFCVEYLPIVHRFARARVRVEAEADDVVQVVMANAARRIETYRGEALLRSWLMQICRNEIAKRYAREQRRPASVSVDGDDMLRRVVESIEAAGAEQPEQQALAHELGARVRAALDELPPRYADALEMKYVDDMSSKEIAAQLGIGDEATQSLLARARRALKAVFTSPDWTDLLSRERDGSAD